VSESGLVAWTYAETNRLLQGRQYISIYKNNLDESEDDVFPGLAVGSKIQIHENRFTFTASMSTRIPRKKAINPNVAAASTSDVETAQSYDIKDELQSQITDFGTGESGGVTSDQNQPSGNSTPRGRRAGEVYNEVYVWDLDFDGIRRVPGEGEAEFSPHMWGNTVAWQEEQQWPFGYEIVALIDNEIVQLTTNTYYELAPRVFENKIVWYGWDGNDYEIFLYDKNAGQVAQITSNLYDDIVPQLSAAAIIWEGYPGVEGDIFMFKDGVVTNISGGVDDDINPRLWNDKVVWQGFDGDDFEIYFFDVTKGGSAAKLTSNNYDDTNPEIGSELITWMGYHDNWDAEVFYTTIPNILPVSDVKVTQLTNNEFDDTDPKTAIPRIVWVSDENGFPQIMLAEPR